MWGTSIRGRKTRKLTLTISPLPPTENSRGKMRAKLIRRYSGMKRSTGRGGYSAVYAVTPDWHPVIDHLPGVEGAICAAGFSGHGFKLAPAAGKLVGELALDGTATTFDIAPLRASRYDEGDLFGSGASASVMG